MDPLSTKVRIQGRDRPAGYHDQARPEVAALVPAACRRVLEVGCGAGQLSSLLRARGHHVTGIELIPQAVQRAAAVLDEVVCADVEDESLSFIPGSFDVLIFADVLEHLLDPWGVLRRCVSWLSPAGRVVVSVPNVQNLDVIRRLVLGRWDYRERGILDVGHLRFFTYRSVCRLFDQAGLVIERVEHRYRRTWSRQLLCAVTLGGARAFLTRQYLVVGKRRG
jgi:SAM-dependent methyltransferase